MQNLRALSSEEGHEGIRMVVVYRLTCGWFSEKIVYEGLLHFDIIVVWLTVACGPKPNAMYAV